MNKISIFPEEAENGITTFSAISANVRASGRTVGEALDALGAHFSHTDSATAIIQFLYPDKFFAAAQIESLQRLMESWRKARRDDILLDPCEQQQLERLVDDELRAAGERASEISVLERSGDVARYQELSADLTKVYNLESQRAASLRRVTFGIAFFQLAALSLCTFALVIDTVSGRLVTLVTATLLFHVVQLIILWVGMALQKRITSLHEAESNITRLLMFDSPRSESHGRESGNRT